VKGRGAHGKFCVELSGKSKPEGGRRIQPRKIRKREVMCTMNLEGKRTRQKGGGTSGSAKKAYPCNLQLLSGGSGSGGWGGIT